MATPFQGLLALPHRAVAAFFECRGLKSASVDFTPAMQRRRGFAVRSQASRFGSAGWTL